MPWLSLRRLPLRVERVLGLRWLWRLLLVLGPLRLVSTEDKRPARGVRNLVRIEVKVAE